MFQDTLHSTPASLSPTGILTQSLEERTTGWRVDRVTLLTDREINTEMQSKTHRDRQTNKKIMKHRLERQRQGVGILPYHRAQGATGHPVQVQ